MATSRVSAPSADEVTSSRGLKPLVQSLRFKLTVWNTIVVLLIAILALVSVRQGLYYMLLRETDAVLRQEAEEIRLMLQQTWPDRAMVFEELNRKSAVHEQHGWFAQVLDGPGSTLWASPRIPDAIRRRRFNAPQPGSFLTLGPHRVAKVRVSEPGYPPFLIRVGTSTDFIRQDVARVTRIFAPVTLCLLLLAPIVGYVLSGRATRPLQKIIRTTEHLRPSRLTDRLPIRGTGDELDQLSRKINAFLDKIADYIRQQREFTADAAHELRSPITAILSSIEIARGRERSPAEYEELLDLVHDECTRLTMLINQLLILAESDAGALEHVRGPVPLDEMARRSVDMFAGVAEERAISLESRLEPDVIVSGDAGQLRQILNNLLDNAIKFTPPDGRVAVSVQRDRTRPEVCLTVTDTGIGIPPEAMPRLFDRFFQVDPSRHRADGQRGSGLGLPICQAIVSAHGGTIAIESSPEGGTAVEVRLPRDGERASDNQARPR
jgi:heavy metal sensor kinase